jgi:hypothetical protein
MSVISTKVGDNGSIKKTTYIDFSKSHHHHKFFILSFLMGLQIHCTKEKSRDRALHMYFVNIDNSIGD